MFIFPSDVRRCNDRFFMLKAPETRLTAVSQGCTHPTLQLQSDQLNMATQDPQEQDL